MWCLVPPRSTAPRLAGIGLLSLTLGCRDKGDAPEPAAQAPTACDLAALEDAYGGAGLSAEVEVRLDGNAVPHISAETDEDAFFASGYLMARERLYPLELMRRRVQGRRAELLGADYTRSDLQARAFGFTRLGCESLAAMAERRPEDLRLALAWLAGVNRRITEVQGDPSLLPPELAALGVTPEAMAPEEFVAIGNAILYGFSSSLEFDLLYTVVARAVPHATELPILQPGVDRFILGAAPPAGPPAAEAPPSLSVSAEDMAHFEAGLQSLRRWSMGPGSNSWAVTGARTDNGLPLVANDTHSSLGDPNTMWMSHLQSPSFDVAGFSFVGVPGVHLGHNAHLSWTATTHWADAVDLWLVGTTEDSVLAWGETLPLDTVTESITVRDADGGSHTEDYVVQSLADGSGVLLTDDILGVPTALLGEGAVLGQWTGMRANDDLSLFLDFDRAQSLADFNAAVDQQDAGMMNWIGATAEGLSYRTHGRLPVRDPATKPNQVLDGADPATAWTTFMADGDFPSLEGRDLLVTANNDPWGHTADNDPTNDAFYYGSFYDPGWRADRITTVLEAATAPLTVADMQALQRDTHSGVAERFIPLLTDTLSRIDTDEALAEFRGRGDLPLAAARLADWDLQMVRSSEEAALFQFWLSYLTRRTIGDEVNLVYDSIEQGKPPYLAKVTLLCHEQESEVALDQGGDWLRLAALSDALEKVAALEAASGAPVTWGTVHRSRFTAPDGSTFEVPTDGGNDTVNSAECPMWEDAEIPDACVSHQGPILRQVTRFTEAGRPEMVYDAPLSNDGDLERWVEGEFVSLPFDAAEVEAATLSIEVLTP